jgi:hypothetical protein
VPLASRSSRRRILQQRDRRIERFNDVIGVVLRDRAVKDINRNDKPF